MNVNFDHSENQSVLRYLGRDWGNQQPQNLSASPDVYDLYHNPLGTHPDLVEYFWKQLTCKLPLTCGWVVYGNPVLVHPDSGIIFGFAGGTHTYALRWPDELRSQAMLVGAKQIYTYNNGAALSLSEIGAEWIFGLWHKEEPNWCLGAFAHAGSM